MSAGYLGEIAEHPAILDRLGQGFDVTWGKALQRFAPICRLRALAA